jgi:hypothetical protein
MTHLLEVSKALHSCVIKNGETLLKCGGPKVEAQSKAKEILDTVNDHNFWHNDTRLVCVPISSLSLVSQHLLE